MLDGNSWTSQSLWLWPAKRGLAAYKALMGNRYIGVDAWPTVVFWWVTPSPHMLPCLEKFALLWPGEVLINWCSPLPCHRRLQGWQAASILGVEVSELSSNRTVRTQQIESCIRTHPGAWHVYSGWRNTPSVYAAFSVAQKDALSRHVVVAEQFRGFGVRYWTRFPWAWMQTLRYRRSIDAILAIGTVGERFYRRIGFPKRVVFPFIYQTSALKPKRFAIPVTRTPAIVFVGTLDLRKGADILIKALARVQGFDWRLSIIGDGVLREKLIELSKRLDVFERVEFCGTLPQVDVMSRLAGFDLCVVPSRFDGWGAVTNEALTVGTPVIVSDRAGSSDLVRYSNGGIVYSGSRPVQALSRSLTEFLGQVPDWRARRSEIKNYAKSIDGQSVAEYLSSVLRFLMAPNQDTRPMAPWMTRLNS